MRASTSLARLWHEGWQDGHAHLAPPGLVAARTVERFRERLAAALSDTFVTGPHGAPDGFFILRGDELYQFFVARAARLLPAQAEAPCAAPRV